MSRQRIYSSIKAYQTSGSCALAAAEPSYLQLVESDDVIVFSPRTPSPRRTPKHVPASAYDKAYLVAIIVFAALVVFGCLFASYRSSERALTDAMTSTQFETCTVHVGDDLWSIASERDIQGLSTAQVVEVIKERNMLEGSMLHPGDTLLVPVMEGGQS